MTRGRGEVRLEVLTPVAAPPQVVFDLALDVDVHTASLARSRESAVTGHGRRQLLAGDEVTFTARHLGRTWSLTSRITVFEPPTRFVDEQVRGPFRALHHEHRFEAGPGGTLMVDRFSFSLPGGVAGALAARLVAGPYLRRLLVVRGAHIAARAADPTRWSPSRSALRPSRSRARPAPAPPRSARR